ncbi:PstS family phosphate ABC transporter substrate-binding protein [Halorussus litoreus]|uniref:PstS family phosphate ABC transporter substrate-binding protein n=1 Tax=Halorussus litoreus TaxID=1710536 RepID=UPI000E22D6EC|nr:PstS family phosphate ABC transporter substrate-binding protein [Halorussus litoreus]
MDGTKRPGARGRREFLVAAAGVGASAVAGCIGRSYEGARAGTDESDLTGNVTITGSSTVYPVTVAVAEEFQQRYAGVDVTVDSTGTGGGFKNHFCPGNSDVNGASRPITDGERENCASNGVEPVEFEVAGDALTVAVNEAADWVDCVTFDELAQIWGPDGAEQWSDVRDDWPDEPFELYGPASTSGTFDWFTENVVGEASSHRSDYEATEDDNIIVQGVEGSPYAMGYMGYAHFEENRDRLKGLEVAVEDRDNCTPPSLDNARSGDYPMARPLFVYPDAASVRENEQVAEFMRFYVENSATDLVKEIGYVPASEELREENLDKLRNILDGTTSTETRTATEGTNTTETNTTETTTP